MSQDVPTTATSPATEPVELAPQPAIPVGSGPVKAGPGISNRTLNLLLGGALVLAIAGVAFAAGRMTAPAQTITGGVFPGGNVPANGQGGAGNGGFQGRPGNGQGGVGVFGGGATIEGTVESISATTLTLKTADGQTIQVALSDTTTYHSQSDATASDVVTGGQVLVRLNLRRADGAPGGPQPTAGTDGGFSLSAGDVTVVP